MIARALLPLLLTILLADLYIDRRFLRRQSWWKRLLWWTPALLLAAWAVKLSAESGFVGNNQGELELFLLLFALTVAPKAVFALCSEGGRLCSIVHRYARHTKPAAGKQRATRNYGNLVGLLCAPLIWYVVVYGAFVGFYQLEVRHIELAFSDLPTPFDGYRIVHFSDAHVGTLRGNRQQLLRQIVDSINAQHADLIAFTGDLQNTQPQDLYPHIDLLSTLKAHDGVYSVLGNHDYAEYTDCDEAIKAANCRETISLERQMGWTLLLNDHRRISRGGATIVVAGMENDSGGRFPMLGDIAQTLSGHTLPSDNSHSPVRPTDFIIMLEHAPTDWRKTILPESHAQLTLSGHTHGGQLALAGWKPLSLLYPECGGVYESTDTPTLTGAGEAAGKTPPTTAARNTTRKLCVSTGVGALIPFRFGMKGEIIVITLKKK